MRRILVGAAVLILCMGTLAQGPPDIPIDRGRVADQVYENPTFGIRWELPKDWAVASESAVTSDHVLLRLLPSGTASPESVELTYREDYQWDEKTTQQMQNKGWESLPGLGYETVGGGIPARRYDYKSKATPTQYLTTLTGPRHGYTVSVVFVAGSEERVQKLMKSIQMLRVRPDWPPNADTTQTSLPDPPRVRISQRVSQVLLQYHTEPPYPPAARKAYVEGSVVMLAHIGIDGLIKELYIENGNALLAPGAINAVSQWKYKPYLLNGQPVEVETQITVAFTLK